MNSPHFLRPALRVLVVDDCRDHVSLLAMLLRLWGHRPLVAYDGPSAIEMTLRHRPDVVLLDIAMPGMDGWEVARRLRRLPGAGGGLLVAVTGFGRAADVRRSEEAGIDCHLVKPVELDAFQRVLAQAASLVREDRPLIR